MRFLGADTICEAGRLRILGSIGYMRLLAGNPFKREIGNKLSCFAINYWSIIFPAIFYYPCLFRHNCLKNTYFVDFGVEQIRQI